MLNKIILGTANFTQPYGIMSLGKTGLGEKETASILNRATWRGVDTLDTALGYGDLSKAVSWDLLKKYRIVTKISVLDNKEMLVEKLDSHQGLSLYGLLIHDPVNIKRVDGPGLQDTLAFLKQTYGFKKIGVSAYDMKDIQDFCGITTPEIIQIPLNPLNQSFDHPSFIEWVRHHGVEVHARSLFLQGILLADKLPEKLKPLHEEWNAARVTLKAYDSPLHGLMLWALKKNWVHRWVMGVSSSSDLDDIFDACSLLSTASEGPIFHPSSHPLADARNWS